MRFQPTNTPPRVLASSIAHGLKITLLWHPDDDAVSVSMTDPDTGDYVQFLVEAHRAMEAFRHPWRYAPSAA